MNKIRVYIPTTDGPVTVERVTREPAAQSAVCVQRTTRVLPISAAYDSFVRAPSGVIEREFGPFDSGAFRLDVSAPIGDGDSWQLGVFVAHALAVDGRLAGPHDACTQAIWATGAVDNDLHINAVGHIPEKIHLSQELTRQLSDEGVSLKAFVPRDNLAVAGAAFELFEVKAADTVGDILNDLGQDVPAAPSAPAMPKKVETPSGPGTTVTLWVLLGLASFVGATYLLFQEDQPVRGAVQGAKPPVASEKIAPKPVAKPETKPETAPVIAPQPEQKPPPPAQTVAKKAAAPLIIGIAELHAPTGVSCAAVQFGNTKAVVIPLAGTSTTRFPDSRVAGLCGLEFSVDAGGAKRFARAVIDVKSGKLLRGDRLPNPLSGAAAFEGRLSWRTYVPKRLSSTLEYTIRVDVGDKPISGSTATSLTAQHRVTP